MRTSFVLFASLLGVTLINPLPASSQATKVEEKPASPVVLKTFWGKPKIEVLEVENESNRRFEKWREKVLVVFGYVLPSSDSRDFVTTPLVRPSFTLQLQTDEKKADFAKRFAELKAEMTTITSAEPQLKKWDLSHWVSKGEVTFPQAQFHSSSRMGRVSYAWLTREFQMEGVRVGKKTMFKAQITTSTDGPFGVVLEGGRTFDLKTGEIIELK